jgi:hypothetical protein
VFLQFTAAVSLRGGTPDERRPAQYYAARDRLGFILEMEDGTALHTDHIQIVDRGEGKVEPVDVEVHIADPDLSGNHQTPSEVCSTSHAPGAVD